MKRILPAIALLFAVTIAFAFQSPAKVEKKEVSGDYFRYLSPNNWQSSDEFEVDDLCRGNEVLCAIEVLSGDPTAAKAHVESILSTLNFSAGTPIPITADFDPNSPGTEQVVAYPKNAE
ncbi:MAG: hypothetical protein BGO09_02955 [Bacteroidetes bacterium 47-18]|nr:MAG: hypothetical protein BGO09_02955 [Bacteroidetes bacterium 47-18]